MAELIQDSGLSEEQARLASVMVESGQALLAIINDILDFSKIEAGRVDLDVSEFDLASVAEGVAELLSVRAAQKGLRLSCFVDPAIPDCLVGDAGRLRQILLNLTSNAVKFTTHGKVALRAELLEQPVDQAMVRLSVSDTGIGIAPDAQLRLFKPFVQADGGTTRRFGGTGLGLAIVKRLVDLMNGAVELQSRPGQGTEIAVVVTLGVRKAARPAIDSERARGRALIVEPDRDSREIATRYLTAVGYQCTTHTEALSALAELRHIPRPDLLVLGLWTDEPATNAAYRAVVADPELRTLRRIVLVERTAEGEPIDGALFRPIKRGALVARAIADVGPQIVRQDPPAAQPTYREPMRAPGPRCVLLAEDNPINQRVASLQLGKLDFDVEAVPDGAAAVAAYRATPERFAAIFMDCQMPVLDGFEATSQIRDWEARDAQGRHVLIIAMTANAMAGDREICIAAGMDDYLSKPVGRQALRQVLSRNDLLEAADDFEPTSTNSPANP